jgi:hypothetical protein
MSKKLGTFLALLLVLASVVPVFAQDTTIADTRERVNGILRQLQTFDNTCVVILGGLVKEVDIDVLHSRKLITVGKGNVTNLLLDTIRAATNGIDRVVDTLEQCDTLLGATEPASANLRVIPAFATTIPQAQEPSDGTIFGEVEAVIEEVETSAEADGLDPRKANKILSLLNSIVIQNLECIDSRLDTIETGVQSASDTVSEVEGTISPTNELAIAMNAARVLPELTETGPIPFEVLRGLKEALGRAHTQLTQVLRAIKRITVCKKWVFKGLREVKELLRASNFGGRAASTLGESVAQIYTLSGRLIETQLNAETLSVKGLANGVYIVVKKFNENGLVRYETEKLVVAR